MSRTYKDKPYRVFESEAKSHGFAHHELWFAADEPREVIEVGKYAYSKGNTHIPVRRHTRIRFIESEWWYTDYGNESAIRDTLHKAAVDYNNGVLDEDWDDVRAYQRRRRWHM